MLLLQHLGPKIMSGYSPLEGLPVVDDYSDNDFTDDTLTIPPVNPEKSLFPYSLVWGPLPLITQLIPFIGHLGIADSQGRIHDFHGPYYVAVDNFMVGDVYKYVIYIFCFLFMLLD